MDKAYRRCEQILSGNLDKLNEVAEFLIRYETMSGQQFADCMEGRTVDGEARTSLFEAFEELAEETEE
jgi:ATP-dependent Zn protease